MATLQQTLPHSTIDLTGEDEVSLPEGAEVVTPSNPPLLTLAAAPVGTRVRVRYLGERELRAQAIRLGLGPGSEVVVWARLPGGPVLVSRGSQRIAVGRRLAEQTWVEMVGTDGR